MNEILEALKKTPLKKVTEAITADPEIPQTTLAKFGTPEEIALRFLEDSNWSVKIAQEKLEASKELFTPEQLESVRAEIWYLFGSQKESVNESELTMKNFSDVTFALEQIQKFIEATDGVVSVMSKQDSVAYSTLLEQMKFALKTMREVQSRGKAYYENDEEIFEA